MELCMEGFLGETPIDVSTHPQLSKYTSSDWAMLFISKYGQIDGKDHKTWVLDRVSRVLKGTPDRSTLVKRCVGIPLRPWTTESGLSGLARRDAGA